MSETHYDGFPAENPEQEPSDNENYEQDDDDEEVEEDEEEDWDSPIVQAKYFTYDAVHDLLKKIIYNFSELGIESDQLVLISKLHMLTERPGKYEVDGYLTLIIKEYFDQAQFTWREIKFDGDGLQLETGSWTNEYGYGFDSSSHILFPTDDDDEAMNIANEVWQFTSGFYESLTNPENPREFTDAIDELSNPEE